VYHGSRGLPSMLMLMPNKLLWGKDFVSFLLSAVPGQGSAQGWVRGCLTQRRQTRRRAAVGQQQLQLVLTQSCCCTWVHAPDRCWCTRPATTTLSRT
jgi:hypothetical protein